MKKENLVLQARPTQIFHFGRQVFVCLFAKIMWNQPSLRKFESFFKITGNISLKNVLQILFGGGEGSFSHQKEKQIK